MERTKDSEIIDEANRNQTGKITGEARESIIQRI